MATFNKFDSFVEKLAKGAFNLSTDTLKILLSNDAPSASADAVKADLTSELGTAGGYTAGGAAVTITSCVQTAGVLSLVGNDLVFTASGGSFGPFRYAVLYDSTASGSPLIGWWDYGSSITVNSGETFTVDFGASILTIT